MIVDGKILHTSKPLADFKSGEVEISLAIPAGAREIELKIDEIDNGNSDWAVWAHPRFVK